MGDKQVVEEENKDDVHMTDVIQDEMQKIQETIQANLNVEMQDDTLHHDDINLISNVSPKAHQLVDTLIE